MLIVLGTNLGSTLVTADRLSYAYWALSNSLPEVQKKEKRLLHLWSAQASPTSLSIAMHFSLTLSGSSPPEGHAK